VILDSLKDGSPVLVSHLFVLTGLCSSRSEATRLIKAGGAYLNNRQLTPPDELVFDYDLLRGKYVFLRRGKRNVAAVEFTVDPTSERGWWLDWSEPVPGPVRDGVRAGGEPAGKVHQA
jgi:hypothetical protein